MVRQYPHKMVVETSTTASTQDASGDWVQGLDEVAEPTPCRHETKAGFVTTDSGIKVQYQGIVYMPLPMPTVALGSRVTLTDNGVQVAAGDVKHISKGQLNARIWL